MKKSTSYLALVVAVCLIYYVTPIFAASTPPVYYNNYNGSGQNAKASLGLWVPGSNKWGDTVTSEMLNNLGGSGNSINVIGVRYWNRSELCGTMAVAYFPQNAVVNNNSSKYFNSSTHNYVRSGCANHRAYALAKHDFNRTGGPNWIPETELYLALPN